MENNELLKKIYNFQIDPADTQLKFQIKLAKENAWTEEFAKEVIIEYKRFIYLAAIANTAVTPSDIIDKAWHMHLTHTKSYWRDLCRDILGFELHHNPTLGGQQEKSKFDQQYQKTLLLYEEVFGDKPSKKIWPRNSNLAPSKSSIFFNDINAWLSKSVLAIFVLTLLSACTDQLGDKGIWFWLKLAVFVYIVYKIFSWLNSGGGGGRNSGGGSCGSACGGD